MKTAKQLLCLYIGQDFRRLNNIFDHFFDRLRYTLMHAYRFIMYGKRFSTRYSRAFGVRVGIVKVGENFSEALLVFDSCGIP